MRTRAFAHGHILDKAHMQRTIDRHLGKRQKILPQATNRYGVHLHRIKPRSERGLNSVDCLMQLASTRDIAKLLRIKRVKRNVHARKARRREFLSILRQKHAISGKGDVIDARGLMNGANQVNRALAHQGLAARQTEPLNTHARRNANHALNFLKAQNIGMAQRRHAIGRHAIDATIIASIRQRDAHIVNHAPVRIFHEGPLRRLARPHAQSRLSFLELYPRKNKETPPRLNSVGVSV